MRHNISIFDTGQGPGSYSSRRNDGFTFASTMVCILLAVGAFVMIIGGLADPTVGPALEVSGAVMLALAATWTGLFLTHRNFGVNKHAVPAMDAIYTLPKTERKKYKIGVNDVNALNHSEVEDLVRHIAEYRRTRTTDNDLSRLTANLSEYNRTVKEIEGL